MFISNRRNVQKNCTKENYRSTFGNLTKLESVRVQSWTGPYNWSKSKQNFNKFTNSSKLSSQGHLSQEMNPIQDHEPVYIGKVRRF